MPDGVTGTDRWAYLAHKSPHTHDVRALATAVRSEGDELLLSGGVDGQIVAYPAHRITQEHPVRLSKAPQAPLLQLSHGAPGGAPRLMLAQGRRISLWRAGRTAARGSCNDAAGSEVAAHEGEPLDLAEPPVCLAELQLRGPRHLACAAAAPGGGALAASDAAGVRLFAVDGSSAAVALRRVKSSSGEDSNGGKPAGPPPAAVAMAFAADGGALYCADSGGCLRCFDAASGRVLGSLQLEVAGGAAVVADAVPAARRSTDGSGSDGGGSDDSDDSDSEAEAEPEAARGRRRRRRRRAAPAITAASAAQPAVSSLAVSPDGRWLAAAVCDGVALVALSPNGGMAHAGPLLLLGDGGASAGGPPVTALAFSCDSVLLAAADAADGLATYTSATRAPTQWSADHFGALRKLLALLPGTVERLSFQPGDDGRSLLVQSAGGICHVDVDAPLSANVLSAKRRRAKGRAGAAAAAPGLNGRVLPLDSPCLFLGYLAPSAALLVERPWEEVTAGLPAPLYRHKYGT